ncbi:hypothetical protein ACTG2V_00090 [Aeromonas sp. 74A]
MEIAPGWNVPDGDARLPRILTLGRDITGLRTTQAQLQQEQHYDSLTGLLKLSRSSRPAAILGTQCHIGAGESAPFS